LRAPVYVSSSSDFRRSNWAAVIVAVAVDQGAGGAGAVGEQSFVPSRRLIVDVDGGCGGLNWGEAVMIVRRVEQFECSTRGTRGATSPANRMLWPDTL
jgi:hypothetical protein